MKQIFNIIIILFCCLSFSISAASKSPIDAKPNVIIFFIDDMGYSDLGVFGAKNSRTPNIDKLGHEGLKFTNFYSGWTAFSPSRASLLTGSHAIRVGMHGSVCFPNKAKAPNAKPMADGNTFIKPSPGLFSIAGESKLQKLAATITPPVKPSIPSKTARFIFLKKNTKAAPKAVKHQVNKEAYNAA